MPETEPRIEIHEDDEGMRNVYPLAARAEAEKDMTTSIEAAERNRAPDGIGWTDVHLIEAPAMTFADAGLTLAAASTALTPLMPRIRRYWAGLLGRNDPLAAYETDAYCFGSAHCFIKLEPKGDLVERIWFEAHDTDAASLATLRSALLAINALSPALIADYWLHATGAVGDQTFLDAYFKALAEA
jgi:hypothetical protein